ncbi:hypothetical protein U8326_10280 [Tsuneonella sp. CC-YZS046]|uniref:hypothetical protein n=1 Tax=Tsuneonella sp. CC-YZS046 TaxID=3042152 RepID=UPI002D78233E|nr:hypothetical protein [Tsuneonella sp. CC-YZS046]WRO65447.1 hypothetical protein U8326_10280 [Tsuneonella sp. CC-YZS046]
MNRCLPLALLATVLLSACGGGKNGDGDGGASGQVAEGTISDAMLPLDTVRSQAPLAAPEATASGTPGAKSTGAASGGSDNAAAAEADEDDAPATPAPEREAPPADPIGAAISGE